MTEKSKQEQLEMLRSEGPKARVKNALSPFKNLIGLIGECARIKNGEKKALLLSTLRGELCTARKNMKIIRLIYDETQNNDLRFETSGLELILFNIETILEDVDILKRDRNLLKFSKLKETNLGIISRVIEMAPEK